MRRKFRKEWLDSPAVRLLILLAACAAAVGGLGCATYFASQAENPFSKNYHTKPIHQDTIYAMGRPDAALARKLGNDKVVAFLGKKNTYLLAEGGETIEAVGQALGSARLALDPGTRRLYKKGRTIWGSITLTCKPESPSETELAALSTLKFVRQKSGDYTLTIPVKGVTAAPPRFKKAQPESFDKTFAIDFHNPPYSSPPPDVSKLLTVPLAIVVDVALTPVYLGLLLYAITS